MGDVAVYNNDVMVEKQVVAEINSLHEEIKSLMSQTFEKGLRLGDLLYRVKSALPHGGFQEWIDQNCPFTYRTARRYMVIWENKEELAVRCIASLAQAYKYLNVKSDTVSLLAGEIEEVSDEDISEQEREIERLRSELETIKDARRTENKEAKSLKKENEDYKNLVHNIKSMRDVLVKIQEIDKKPSEESIYEIAEVQTYISKAEKFFIKHIAGIEELPIEKLTIKAMREPVSKLLTAMDSWAVRVAKRFKVKLDEDGDVA